MISTHKIGKTAVIDLPTDLNNKAETSLSNLSSEGRRYVAFKGYDSSTSYSLNDIVVSTQNNEVKIYQSLVDSNTSSSYHPEKLIFGSISDKSIVFVYDCS